MPVRIARESPMPPTTQQTATTIFYRNLRWLKFVDRLGKQGAGILEYLGGLGTLLSQTARAAFTRPFYGSEVVAQMDELGVAPDHRIHGLSELPALLSTQRS